MRLPLERRRVPSPPLASLFALALALAPALALGAQQPAPAAAEAVATRPDEAELLDVVEVVDGDTLHVMRGGEREKLRLLSVDTEEKITGRPNLSATKPETVFGQESALWAKEFFASLAEEGEAPRVALLFPESPGGREARDVYGRLLCHVILPDGRDFNVLLVRLGKSPYFNKYGNSTCCHADFVAAQAAAREEGIGIWDPETNAARTPGAPSAKRPYERLIPWWDARAAAVDDFRARSAEEPVLVVAADEPAALERARNHCAEHPEETVEVFGTIERFFDERSGERTVLFRSGDSANAFRAVVPPSAAAAMRAFDLDRTTEEFRQNYLYVRGVVRRGARGFTMVAGDPGQWRLAGPEPERGGTPR
jgi:endonuclease YncB( thermonuclease family)